MSLLKRDRENKNFAASVNYYLREDKRRVGFGTKCFFPPDLALTDRAASGRLLICCSSPAKGGERVAQKILKKMSPTHSLVSRKNRTMEVP